MSIREACVEDASRVHELLGQIMKLHHDMYPDIFVSATKYGVDEVIYLIQDETRKVYVYEDETGLIQGYLIGWFEEYGFFVDDLCVNEDYRGHGVGEKLMAILDDFDEIRLNVWDKNEGARHFYEKQGFETIKYVLRKKKN